MIPLVVVAGCAAAGWYTYNRARDPDRLARLGREAIEARDWDAADEYADRLIAHGHRDRGRLLRGEALYKQNRLESAVELLNRIRDEGDLRVEAARLQGLCFLELNNQSEAERALRFVLDHRPDDLDTLRAMAVIAYDQGNWIQAEGFLRKVAELDQRDGRPLWTLGIIHRDLHRFREAEEHFRSALARDLPGELPKLVRADLATALTGQKRFAEALAELDAARLDVISPSIARMKVDCLRSLGRYADALAFADSFLAQRPNDPGLLAEKGTTLVDDRKFEAAIVPLERSVAGEPNDPRARDALRRAYQALGRTADAEAQQKKMLEAEALFKQLSDLTYEAMEKPWDPAVRRKLAEVCLKLNKKDLARMWAATADAGEVRTAQP